MNESRRYLRDVLASWPVLAFCVLLGTAGAVAATLIVRPVYSATSVVYVAVNAGNSIANLSAGSQYTQNIVTSLATVATTPIVLENVARQVGGVTPQSLADQIVVSAPEGTVVLSITATDTSPTRAANIVNGVARSLAAQVPGITSTAGTESPVRISTIENAVPSSTPISPKLTVDLAIGIAGGLTLGLFAAAILQLLDSRIRDSDELEELTGVPVLVHIPFDGSAPLRPLTVKTAPRSSSAEAYRSLRAKLRFFISKEKNVLLITSAMPAEGKSTAAANLALAYADTGLKVALVDLDMRRPTVAATFGLDNGLGASDVLSGAGAMQDVRQQWGEGQLSVFPAGETPPNPSELLSGPAADEFMDALRREFDIVLLDAPPLLPVADSVLLAAKADGVVLMTADRRSRRNQLVAARRNLLSGNARLLGVVVASTRQSSARTGARYGYGYGYGYETTGP